MFPLRLDMGTLALFTRTYRIKALNKLTLIEPLVQELYRVTKLDNQVFVIQVKKKKITKSIWERNIWTYITHVFRNNVSKL